MKFKLAVLWTLFLLLPLREVSARLSVALPSAPSIPEASEFPLRGWSDTYTDFIKKRVEQYPEFLAMSGKDVGRLCSNWDQLDREARKMFWVNFIKSISYGESGWVRGEMTQETASNLRMDLATKRAVFSEGLLQISYGSVSLYKKVYQSESCDVPFEGDEKSMFVQDARNYKFKHERMSENANDRELLNPIRNIACSLDIMYLGYLRKVNDQETEALRKGVAIYWGTLRVGRNGFTNFSEQFKKENKSAPHPCDFDFSGD